MKTIIRKAYVNFEKEEKWLNEMSAKGLALVDYTWCRYVFEPCKPGEYIYRIELLENMPSHPESAAYLRFVEETGAECVTTYLRWVYFRKRASEGAFEIFTDVDSRIRHLKKVACFFGILAAAEYMICLSNIMVGLDLLFRRGMNMNLWLSFLVFALGCLIMGAGFLPSYQSLRRLKREKLLHE